MDSAEPLYQSPWPGPTQWWVMNPGPFIDICFANGVNQFVFTEKIYKFIPNMRLSPERLLQAVSRGRDWSAILVEADYKDRNTYGQVAVEYGSESWFERPVGVYPMWSAANDSIEKLEEMTQWFEPGRRVGRFFGDEHDMKIVEDQKRQIIVRSLPVYDAPWNSKFKAISEIKAEHPDIRFHFCGGKSVIRTIGMGVDSFDHPTRIGWNDKMPILMLPNGQRIEHHNHLAKEGKIWADLIGRSPQKIFELPTNQEMSRAAYEFNLLSIKWLSVNYDRVWHPGIGGMATDPDFDHESPDYEWEPKDDLVRLPQRLRRERFDRWLCDVCSVALSCPYARPGAVCIVEDSPTTELVTQFKSRRAADIIEGLGQLIQINVDRMTKGLQYEAEKEKIDPNVSKLIDSIFDRGVQLAKLRDPQIAAQMGSGSKIQIGIATQGGSARTILQASNSAELMAGVAAMLDKEGIPIEEATEEDVVRVLGAIEAEARE